MSGKQRGQFSHTIGGKSYDMLLTFAKLDELETKLGMGVIEIADNVHTLRTAQMVEALCLGIEGADGAADRRMIGAAVVADGVTTHARAIGRLIALALMGPDEVDAAQGGASGNGDAASD